MICVFKTSVQSETEATAIGRHIGNILPHAKWNFDLEDCDRILRIDSEENSSGPVIRLLQQHHFYCEELE